MKQALFSAALIVLIAASVNAQDCTFTFEEEGTIGKALDAFHEVMSELWHGPAEEGNAEPIKEKFGEMASLRDAIMQSTLSAKFEPHCADISANAADFSMAIDDLGAVIESGAEAEAIIEALSKVHDAYAGLRQSMILIEDMIESIHDVLHPIWHDAYPAKDTDAIVAAIPKLKVRTKLLISLAQRAENEELVSQAQALLDAIVTLEEAAAAEDSVAILSATEFVHEAFHAFAEE